MTYHVELELISVGFVNAFMDNRQMLTERYFMSLMTAGRFVADSETVLSRHLQMFQKCM